LAGMMEKGMLRSPACTSIRATMVQIRIVYEAINFGYKRNYKPFGREKRK
jgi:hypothetical protein